MDFAYTVAGFAVGAIVGLTGVGGGSLMTPLLVLMFGIHPSVAVGTDLLYAAITKAGGTLAHGLKGTVDWTVTRRLASGSIPAAVLTLLFIGHFAPGGIDGATGIIKVALGIALVLTAVAIIFRKRIQEYALVRFGENPDPRRTAILTVLTGAVLGVLVSISSVGAGALGVTALFFLYPRLPTLRIVGSDIAHAVPLTAVAGMGHWMLGSVDWLLLGSLIIGSLPGIWLGSHISTKVPDRVLRPILATMLMLVGAKLITH
ncbi:sulfite exporter TauE/SafE family protein [Cognatazoarcus halotolerans]|uniref:sulfite exporter TauE/SafE family protein n=1 Tax=Cognatazoarcus halotolerans TaxID=2686016 RepID=UPI001356BC8E|nr:sulfite exporter TauE/SafE family protein [Cognatazoarcus halotolerans]MCB1901342.1 sulfite exporter TauE/SafE family protein [Rhodocyclaceae bacterium]MCP5307872.1 sulfite exporter TauE/SafE family protein [Zoogloeaceae bacterium]